MRLLCCFPGFSLTSTVGWSSGCIASSVRSYQRAELNATALADIEIANSHRGNRRASFYLLLLQLILCFVGGVSQCYAETPQWTWHFGREQRYVLSSLRRTEDGGYVAVGKTERGATVEIDAWVMKLDSAGAIVWQKAFDSGALDALDAVEATPGGGAIAAGLLQRDLWIVNLDANGRVVWQKIYGGGTGSFPFPAIFGANDIRSTSDGGYVVAGTRYEGGSTSAWVMKLDHAGNITWQRAFGGADYGRPSFRRILPTPDGGYVIGGSAPPYGTDGGIALVVKIGPDGDIRWQRQYERAGTTTSVADLVLTPQGGYLMVGYTAFPSGSDYTQAWMLNLDGVGNVVWQKTLGGKDIGSFFAMAAQPESDGFVVVGTGVPVSIPGYSKERSWDAMVWKIDPGGNLVWQRAYGGQFSEHAVSAQIPPDGGYVIAGSTSYIPGTGVDSWVIKLGANGAGTDCTNMLTSSVAFGDGEAVASDSNATPTSSDAQSAPSAVAPRDTSVSAIRQCYYGGMLTNYQGLWWNSPAGSESGWGINFAHQGEIIFATWFTYDLSGKPRWLAMSANQNAENVFSGALYQTAGPAFGADPFNPSEVVPTPVGTGMLTFTNANSGTFSYVVNGIRGTKPIIRQEFGEQPTCVWGWKDDLKRGSNYQDLWWASPGGSESGWGINFAHEGDTIFATWNTYDVDGSPLWLVGTISNLSYGNNSGTLYETTGPPFNSTVFDPDTVTRTPVGTFTLTFADGNTATFGYRVALPGFSALTQTKQLTRQVFRSPGTVCCTGSRC